MRSVRGLRCSVRRGSENGGGGKGEAGWVMTCLCAKGDVDPRSGQRAVLSMRPHFLVASLAVLAACGGGTAVSTSRPAPSAGGAAAAVDAVITGAPRLTPEWGLAGRAKATTGARAMVVSGHPLASEVGIEVLKQGGNAIDAAVAVGFALEVVLPEAGNIGGGGFIVYRDATGRVRALDYRETAPAGASRDMYLDSTGHMTEPSLTGHLASGVPGSVAGMYEAWKKYGRRPWATLIAPAIRLAEGHMLDAVRSRDLEAEADRLRLFPASARQFLVEGHAPAPGAMFRQPELARTLRLIADSGPDVVYRGQSADSIVAAMQRVCAPRSPRTRRRRRRPSPWAATRASRPRTIRSSTPTATPPL